MSELPVDYSA